MTDVVSKETRSRIMSSVRSKNTRLELEIRHRLFALGFRYRLHSRGIPGTPDIVLRKYSAVIFVNGCFWHNHGCHLSTIPHARRGWWKKKLQENRRRDSQVVSELRELGWRVLTIWECGFRRPRVNRSRALDKIVTQAAAFLNSHRPVLEIPRLPQRQDNGRT